tara:strand:+ start:1897 stop:2982 length:1086 start_codon:yes stop_codon:yes gene_type:complete
MKIQTIQVDLLKVPANMVYEAAGHSVSHNWHIVTRVTVENGTEGIGWLVNTRPAFIYPLYEATKELGQLLIDEEVEDNELLYSLMSSYGNWVGPGGFLNMAMSSIDIAVWDVKAKLNSRTVASMLGGYSNSVKAYASDRLWYSMPIEELLESAKKHIDAGHDRIKLRIGKVSDISEQISRISRLQQEFGSLQIMLDATESWNLSEAASFGESLSSTGIIWLEDPIYHLDFEGLRSLRDTLSMPIAGGEHLYTFESFRDTIKNESVDVLIIDLSRVGGVTPWMKVAHMADSEDILVAGHVLPEFHVHLLSAVKNGYLVEDMPRSENILESNFVVKDGNMLVPDGDGFGIKLDEAACLKYKVS